MQSTPFFSQLQHNRRARIWVATASNCRTKLNGRHPPPLSLAPDNFLRPPCTAWGPYLFGPKSCPLFCPPRTALPVDNWQNWALRDSKSMTPLGHQAGTLLCKVGPETGRRCGKEGMQDRQFDRQPVARQKMRSGGWVQRKRISSAATRK